MPAWLTRKEAQKLCNRMLGTNVNQRRESMKITRRIKQGILAVSSGVLMLAAPASVAAYGMHANQQYSSPRWHSMDDEKRQEWNSYDYKRYHKKRWHGFYSNKRISQERCEQWQQTLSERVDAFKAGAQTDMNFMASTYATYQAFVTSENLTVSNYEAHQARIENRQNRADARAHNVTAPDFNCENEPTIRSIVRKTQGTQESIQRAKNALERYDASLDRLQQAIQASYNSQTNF